MADKCGRCGKEAVTTSVRVGGDKETAVYEVRLCRMCKAAVSAKAK